MMKDFVTAKERTTFTLNIKFKLLSLRIKSWLLQIV